MNRSYRSRLVSCHRPTPAPFVQPAHADPDWGRLDAFPTVADKARIWLAINRIERKEGR